MRLGAKTRLLLGHDEIAGEAAAEIEVQRLRLANAAPPLHFIIEMRVDVEAEKIEIGREVAAEVDVVETPQIVEDEPVGIDRTQDLNLIALEPRCDRARKR